MRVSRIMFICVRSKSKDRKAKQSKSIWDQAKKPTGTKHGSQDRIRSPVSDSLSSFDLHTNAFSLICYLSSNLVWFLRFKCSLFILFNALNICETKLYTKGINSYRKIKKNKTTEIPLTSLSRFPVSIQMLTNKNLKHPHTCFNSKDFVFNRNDKQVPCEREQVVIE